MPTVIDLQESETLSCPYDKARMRKVIYFGQFGEFGQEDEDGNPMKDHYICTNCGFSSIHYTRTELAKIQADVNESAPNLAKLLDQREKTKDSRKKHDRRPSAIAEGVQNREIRSSSAPA